MLFLIVAVVAAAASASEGADGLRLHGFADSIYYSANVSRGKVPFARPILFQEFEVDVGWRDWGDVLFYYAPTHSLTAIRDSVSRRLFMEDDILVAYAYNFKLADGWALRTRNGGLWILARNLKPPYRGVDDKTAFEWYTRETLVTPWVNFYAAVHYRERPYQGVYFKSGFIRTFDLGRGLSLTAELCSEGGNKEWNQNRYGHRITWRKSDYRAGPADLRSDLTLSCEIFENCRIFAGIHTFDMIMDEARAQGKYHAAKGYRNDVAYYTLGVIYSF